MSNHTKEDAMRKWLPPIVAALSVAIVLPTLAGAARDRRCSLNLTFLTAPVNVTGNPPVTGTETRAGTVDGRLCGTQFWGAARLVITYTAPGRGTIHPFAIFGPSGSLDGTFHVIGVRQPDGSVSLSGSGTITGGTGLYTGATGSLSATGTRLANSSVNIVHDTGTLRL
jgi:hypothetical protein